MRKVVSFELKKLVSRIGIYILVVLLAGLLVAGIFMHKPEERKIVTHNLIGETVTEMYNSFNNDLKQKHINSVRDTANNASTYIKDSSNYQIYNDSTTLYNLYEKFDDYCLLYNETSTALRPDYTVLLVAMKQTLAEFKTALDEAFEYSKNQTGYYVLTTNQNYTKLYTLINTLPVYTSSFDGNTYYNEYRTPIYNCLNKLVYPTLQDTASKYAIGGSYYNLTLSRMEEIAAKIDESYSKVATNNTLEQDKTIKQEINQLYNRYLNCADLFNKAYQSDLCVSALTSINSKTDRANLVGYNKVSLYEQEELKTQYHYFIEHNNTANDFAIGLSVTHTSNGKINAYDFTYFIMSLFTVAIVVFAIYLASHTISGEINNNTMRFTAVRPVKRSSLFMGKYVAILIISLILLLFGTITSLCVGGIMYGFNSADILMLINSKTVLVAHPLVLIGIFALSNLLTVALYTAIAILFSTLLKSDLLAMVISVVIYVVNLILPLFFGASSWLKFYPFTNINLFAYFSSTKLTSDSILSKMFNTVVYGGMNIWISLIYIIGITTIILLISKVIFKKREL